MSFVDVLKEKEIAVLTFCRGKVNAINEAVVDEIIAKLEDLENNKAVKGIILTGHGKFFSFGFDIPEFLSYSKESFVRYLIKFTKLYRNIFLFPKPVIAALNGHTIAGGCMIATSCDSRIMVEEKAKISLNEITFGSTVLAGSVEILKFCTGYKHAQEILYSGAMYTAEEAIRFNLIDQISYKEDLIDNAIKAAVSLAEKDNAAFRSIKDLLRRPVAEEFARRENDSILKFADIWYSENTWEKIKKITIKS